MPMLMAAMCGLQAEDAVHILVDTTGYTMRQRTEFIALSNAPIVCPLPSSLPFSLSPSFLFSPFIPASCLRLSDPRSCDRS